MVCFDPLTNRWGGDYTTDIMYMDWNPSETTLAKMKKISNYRKQGKIWIEIAKLMNHDKTYVLALYRKFKQMKGESIGAS